MFKMLLAVFIVCVSAYAVSAQDFDKNTLRHVQSINAQCVTHWEDAVCLQSLSALSLDVVSQYAESLNEKFNNQLEPLKQHCAASTAATETTVPAYALRSALTECLNIISDINDQTLIAPDLDLYQLLVGSVLCLGQDATCSGFEGKVSAAALSAGRF